MSLTGKPDLTTRAPVTNDGFWPDLHAGHLADRYRVPTEYPDDTIIWGLTLALVNVNIELEPVKAAIQALGFASLAAYSTAHPNPLNGADIEKTQYEHAVYARAKAKLLPQFNLPKRAGADANPDAEAQTEQYWLDESANAIAWLFAAFAPDPTKLPTAGVHAALI